MVSSLQAQLTLGLKPYSAKILFVQFILLDEEFLKNLINSLYLSSVILMKYLAKQSKKKWHLHGLTSLYLFLLRNSGFRESFKLKSWFSDASLRILCGRKQRVNTLKQKTVSFALEDTGHGQKRQRSRLTNLVNKFISLTDNEEVISYFCRYLFHAWDHHIVPALSIP